MHRFKVDLCTNQEAHDWLECPFAHKGEKAARRDPRTHNHMSVICPDIRRSGRCPRGDSCPYAHSVFELHLHPNRYRTQLCTMGSACRRAVCFFAHTLDELRSSPDAAADGSAAAAATAPRGLSFDLSADGGAAAAAAMRAAAARPGAGRASFDTAVAGGGLATTSFGALGPAVRPPPSGRPSFEAITRPAGGGGSGSFSSGQLRLSLPSLPALPAELGFAAAEDGYAAAAAAAGLGFLDGCSGNGNGNGGGSPLHSGGLSATGSAFFHSSSNSSALPSTATPSAHGASWLLPGSGNHYQDVRAAMVLLDRTASEATSVASASPTGSRTGGRRSGLDGGSRPAAPWIGSSSSAPLLPHLNRFDSEQQRMFSALLVQHQCEQLAAAQCEQFAAQRRDALEMALAREQHAARASLIAQQQQQQQQAAAAASARDHQEQEHAAALQALWMQERRAAAATAAAMAAAQQESDALAALRWELATQQYSPQSLAGLMGGHGQAPPQMPVASAAELAAAGAAEYLGLSNQLSMLQMQRS